MDAENARDEKPASVSTADEDVVGVLAPAVEDLTNEQIDALVFGVSVAHYFEKRRKIKTRSKTWMDVAIAATHTFQEWQREMVT